MFVVQIIPPKLPNCTISQKYQIVIQVNFQGFGVSLSGPIESCWSKSHLAMDDIIILLKNHLRMDVAILAPWWYNRDGMDGIG